MAPDSTPAKRLRLAAVVTAFKKIYHPEEVLDRFFEGYGWQGVFHHPAMDVVSMYIDQKGDGDMWQDRVYRFAPLKVYDTIEGAVTLGTGKLAVDGILAVGEHGEYALAENGIMKHPHWEFFDAVTKVFRASGRSVPYFNDKELSWNWEWCKAMVATAKELNFPFQGGSSLAVTWRVPSVEFPLGAVCKEALSIGYGGMTSYDFHALETLQCMVERRQGGESGVEWVQAYQGDAFWRAYEGGQFPLELVKAALCRSSVVFSARDGFNQVMPTVAEMKLLAKAPLAYQYQHRDGLRSTMLLLDGVVRDFTFAAHIEGQSKIFSTQMYLPMPDGRTTLASFFSGLIHNAEEMFRTGKAQYPIERTLMTSGLLIFGVNSARAGGVRLPTPELAAVQYQPNPESTFMRS